MHEIKSQSLNRPLPLKFMSTQDPTTMISSTKISRAGIPMLNRNSSTNFSALASSPSNNDYEIIDQITNRGVIYKTQSMTRKQRKLRNAASNLTSFSIANNSFSPGNYMVVRTSSSRGDYADLS